MIRRVKILAVSGSLQRRSSNAAILRTAQRVAPAGVEVVDSIPVGDIPAFNPDVERDGPGPAAVVTWRGQVAASAGVLIASPEYAHSLPGSLKNALDWLVGSGELYGRPVAVLCGSPRPNGGVLGREALGQTLRAQGADVVTSVTIGVVASDKGSDELHDPVAVAAVRAALDALTGRSG
ncbi:MAG TPA: NADPH-dependent FMN reductase, partial [Acidimicrobiales bacterium]|nr:NADPH-dependent FMN reductase [Acidimicrobiales bacterium]